MTTRSPVPVIAGAAQVVQRPGDVELELALGPIELMAKAAHGAADDAGAPSLLSATGWIGVAGGLFRYHNPGRLVAEMVGVPQAATALTAISGTGPQDLVAVAAERISRGELEVALVLGGEARWSHQRMKRSGLEPHWVAAPGAGDPERLSEFAAEMINESAVIGAPATAYALIEDRLRSEAGRSAAAQVEIISRLWARFSEVAAANPYAWDRVAHSADEIATPGPTNRMISTPYTKAMVANNTVDMASAILLCSAEAASRAGVPHDRLVYPQVVASANETWRVATRNELHRLPALSTAGRAAFEHTGTDPDDLDHVELYACFPSIVQVSAATLGISVARPLTITGGLGFAGAAVGNATGHAIAAMVHAIRRGGTGLVHGNGGNATKHSIGIYAPEPSVVFKHLRCQDRVDHQSRQELPGEWAGMGTVEASTVVFDRNGPVRLLAAVRSGEARCWAHSTDPEILAGAASRPITGTEVRRAADGTLSVPSGG